MLSVTWPKHKANNEFQGFYAKPFYITNVSLKVFPLNLGSYYPNRYWHQTLLHWTLLKFSCRWSWWAAVQHIYGIPAPTHLKCNEGFITRLSVEAVHLWMYFTYVYTHTSGNGCHQRCSHKTGSNLRFSVLLKDTVNGVRHDIKTQAMGQQENFTDRGTAALTTHCLQTTPCHHP